MCKIAQKFRSSCTKVPQLVEQQPNSQRNNCLKNNINGLDKETDKKIIIERRFLFQLIKNRKLSVKWINRT